MPKKHILDCDDKLWKEVLKFKIDKDFQNNNETLVELIKRGLKGHGRK
jgi:hypothetical protein